LDSVAKRGSGHTPDKKHPEYWNGNIKWISLADSHVLDCIFIDDTFAKITPEGIANSSAVLHPAGTVVLSRDAGVGKSAIMCTEMAVSQHFMAWRCGSLLDNHFLYYWLQSAKPEFERIANGSTIKTIGLPYFQALKIPHPPLPEQRAIAEALSDVDALVGKLEQLIAKKRDLKQAAMQRLLTGQQRLPGFSGKWETKRLGEFGSTFGGLTGKNKSDFGEGTARYITFMNIMTNIVIDCDRFEPVKVSPTESQNRVMKGDLFFNGSSETPEEVAMCSVLTEDVHEVFLNSFCFGFRLRAGVEVDAIFLCYYFRSREGRELMKSLAQGSTRYNLSKTALLAAPFFLPSLPEQTAIAAVLSDMDTEIAALEARREKTRALKQGMMQELLTGRIRLI
jgi:type I restriction enzyme S subunit